MNESCPPGSGNFWPHWGASAHDRDRCTEGQQTIAIVCQIGALLRTKMAPNGTYLDQLYQKYQGVIAPLCADLARCRLTADRLQVDAILTELGAGYTKIGRRSITLRSRLPTDIPVAA